MEKFITDKDALKKRLEELEEKDDETVEIDLEEVLCYSVADPYENEEW